MALPPDAVALRLAGARGKCQGVSPDKPEVRIRVDQAACVSGVRSYSVPPVRGDRPEARAASPRRSAPCPSRAAPSKHRRPVMLTSASRPAPPMAYPMATRRRAASAAHRHGLSRPNHGPERGGGGSPAEILPAADEDQTLDPTQGPPDHRIGPSRFAWAITARHAGLKSDVEGSGPYSASDDDAQNGED